MQGKRAKYKSKPKFNSKYKNPKHTKQETRHRENIRQDIEVTRVRSTEERTWREQNYRQRETEGRTKETLKGHGRAWKNKDTTRHDTKT